MPCPQIRQNWDHARLPTVLTPNTPPEIELEVGSASILYEDQKETISSSMVVSGSPKRW